MSFSPIIYHTKDPRPFERRPLTFTEKLLGLLAAAACCQTCKSQQRKCGRSGFGDSICHFESIERSAMSISSISRKSEGKGSTFLNINRADIVGIPLIS